MSLRTYPYTAWGLTPAYKLKPINIVGLYGPTFGQCADRSEAGKFYIAKNLHTTPEAALDWGIAQLLKEQAQITKQQAVLTQRLANLTLAQRTLINSKGKSWQQSTEQALLRATA